MECFFVAVSVITQPAKTNVPSRGTRWQRRWKLLLTVHAVAQRGDLVQRAAHRDVCEVALGGEVVGGGVLGDVVGGDEELVHRGDAREVQLRNELGSVVAGDAEKRDEIRDVELCTRKLTREARPVPTTVDLGQGTNEGVGGRGGCAAATFAGAHSQTCDGVALAGPHSAVARFGRAA